MFRISILLRPALLAPCCLAAALALACTATPRLAGLLSNTALLAGGALAISLPLGTIWGTAISKVDVVGRQLLTFLLGGMLLVPLSVQAGAWQAALGSGGWWSQVVGRAPYAPAWLDGLPGAIWVHGMAATPWAALCVAAALATIPRSVEEEALLDASSWRVVWRVSLPRAAGGWGAAAVWIALQCSTEIAVTDFFLTTATRNTFAEEIYKVASLGGLWSGGSDVTNAAAAGADVSARSGGPLASGALLRGAGVLGLGALAGIVLLAIELPVVLTPPPQRRWLWRPMKRWTATCIAWSTVALCLVVPLLGLVGKAGTVVTQHAGRAERGWSVVALLAHVAASPWRQRREWGWTLLIASAATVLALAAGFVAAWFARQSRLASVAASLGLAAAIAIPAPLWAEALIVAFNRSPDSSWAWLGVLYDRTILAPVLVQAIRALPASGLLLWTVVRSVPQELLDAARSEGMGPWHRLVFVGAPLCGTGVLIAGALAFTTCMGELSATLLVTPPGVTPLAVRLFGLLHYGVDDQAAAICLSQICLCLLPAVAWAQWGGLRWVHGERGRIG